MQDVNIQLEASGTKGEKSEACWCNVLLEEIDKFAKRILASTQIDAQRGDLVFAEYLQNLRFH